MFFVERCVAVSPFSHLNLDKRVQKFSEKWCREKYGWLERIDIMLFDAKSRSDELAGSLLRDLVIWADRWSAFWSAFRRSGKQRKVFGNTTTRNKTGATCKLTSSSGCTVAVWWVWCGAGPAGRHPMHPPVLRGTGGLRQPHDGSTRSQCLSAARYRRAGPSRRAHIDLWVPR